MTGIYLMTNNLNGKTYVGQSRNMRKRWQSHGFPSNLKPGHVLSRAIIKYGYESFSFGVLERCAVDALDDLEKHYIAFLKPQYNMTIGGRGIVGNILSEETRSILSQKAKQQWDRMTDLQKQERLQRLGKQQGHTFTSEARCRISSTLKKYFQNNTTSPVQRQRSSEVNRVLLKGNCRGNKKVVCFDLTGNMVGVFSSVKLAAKFVNIHPAGITKALKKTQSTAGGYVWAYAKSCSVETIPQGSTVEISTTGSAEHPFAAGGDIVQTTAIVKLWVTDQGILDLAYRTGMFKMLYCESVYENDTFSYCYGLHKDLKHTPANKDRGNLIGVYAVFHLHNGGWDFKYWTVDQILDHAKKYSQSWDERESKFRKGSAWADNFDGMAKVPVIKDLLKLAPKSIEFQKQLTFDGSSKVEILPDMTEAKDAAVIDISLPVPGCLHPEDRREGDACAVCGEVVGAVAEPPKEEAKEAEKETTQKG